MTTPMPTPGHSASDHPSGHTTREHNAVPTPAPKPTAVATGVVTPRVAIKWALAGAAGAWFAVVVLTTSRSACLAAVALIALAAGAYQAGWIARGRADGR